MRAQRLNLTYTRICALPECRKEFSFKLRHKKRLYCDRKCANLARRTGGLIAQKVEATTIVNHGVRRFFCDQSRLKEVLQVRYGVDNVSNVPGLRKDSWLKAHETKKKNGTYKSSKVERDVCDALETEGVEIMTQYVMLERPIDVFLVDENFYLQIDGRYWHGLDISIEDIRASNYPRDHTIVLRWEADRRQDEQFAEL